MRTVSFVTLGELGLVPTALAQALAPSAGLRNRLVDEYDRLDDGKVLAGIAHVIGLAPDYIKAVIAVL